MISSAIKFLNYPQSDPSQQHIYAALSSIYFRHAIYNYIGKLAYKNFKPLSDLILVLFSVKMNGRVSGVVEKIRDLLVEEAKFLFLPSPSQSSTYCFSRVVVVLYGKDK